MNDLKGKFKLNRKTVKAMLISQSVMATAITCAADLGKIDNKYVGTQRCWVKGTTK